MIKGELAAEVGRLLAQRTPFVVATVIRARRPTSVRPGDAAIVLPDGSVKGFVGGVCAESSVRLHSLRALETGEPLLLRLVPEDGLGAQDADAIEGAVVERNPCLSGGALEIFLEPRLPPARLIVVGGSPTAEAVATLAGAAGYECVRSESGGVDTADPVTAVGDELDLPGAAAVIVAAHGAGEETVLRAALTAGVPYVALVASRRRGAAVRDRLHLAPELSGQLHTPAGLDIGARTPAEIAVSILAEMIALQHADPAPGPTAGVAQAPAPARVAVTTDPVCGMQVAITDAAPRVKVGKESLYFCSDRCRQAYARP